MGFFKKRKINKNASVQPRIITDYYSAFSKVKGIDGTAFACIDRIASEFALLNYGIYKTSDKQKETKHPLYAVIKEPNLDDRHFNFFYQSAWDYYNDKGCFWLVRRYDGEVISLFRLNPAQVRIMRNETTRKREFIYNGAVFGQEEIVYIPSRFGYSTATGGTSIFDAVPSVFDTSKSLENYTQQSFNNGVLGKRLVVDISNLVNDPTEEQLKTLKDNMQAEYAGVENVSRPLFKKKGVSYEYIGDSSDNRTAELSQNREIQKDAMATIFAVTKKILSGDSPSEMDFAIFSEFAIRPMATQFEEAINSLLDEDRFHFEFDYNGVMKVSLSQRIDSYIKQINNSILSPNEVRAKENLPPIEAGENHFMAANMMPLNDEIIEAYMAKQKQAVAQSDQGEQINDPTDPDTQHIPQGDDKQ